MMGTVLPFVAGAKCERGNEDNEKKGKLAVASVKKRKKLLVALPTAARPFDGAENVSFCRTPSQLVDERRRLR